MNLVDHYLEIHRVAAFRVGALRRVTKHADCHVASASLAVRVERVVALVAGGGDDHLPNFRDLAPVRDKIQRLIGDVEAQAVAPRGPRKL